MTQVVAIIGGGVIGAGWAARFLLMGWTVNVFDPDPEAERKTNVVVDNARRALPGLYDAALPEAGSLVFKRALAEAVKDADWVQESVPERLDIKRATLADIQNHCREDAIIASSTSGFRASELKAGSKNPDSIIVAHPFNPVYLIPVVELVGNTETVARAQTILSGLGMRPVHVRKEIDAHIADRLLEALWREGLWLVNDDIATTQEIDDIITFGFGLRWAQMGLFETYRVAGGEAGMTHFMAQFGPALKWPWTKLMDVPELTDALVQKIADQSDAQSGHHSIRALERKRDDNLVAILRALKTRDWGAGALLNAMDATLTAPGQTRDGYIKSVDRCVPVDWTDYNLHMNEGRYGQVFSDAADAVMADIGADTDYIKSGLSYFTVETTIQYRAECVAGDRFYVASQIILAAGKKLKLAHKMVAADGTTLATCEQFLLHVDLTTRKSSPPRGDILEKTMAMAARHQALPPLLDQEH